MPDPDIRLNLQKALYDAIELGDYMDVIKYREDPPAPAFSREDWWWIQNTLKEKKLVK